MKSLQIDAKQALELYPSASTEMKAVFESTFGKSYFSKKITNKIQNYDNALYYVGPSLNTEQKASHDAYLKLLKITEAYNEGWIADYIDPNQYKYYNYFYKNDSSGSVSCDCWSGSAGFPFGLCFKSRELAEDAMSKFKDIYEQYFMIG